MPASGGQRFDAIVIGVGGMGSATVFHLARRGQRVLGLERFDIPHEMGSSHGVTRIIRLTYYEHPSYVPLLRRAYELWRELEADAGEQLLFITGSIDASVGSGRVFEGSLESARLHRLAHEVLSGEEVNRRFPGYRLPPDTRAVLQPDGGFLLPERCIVAHVNAALSLGAEVHAREQVVNWEVTGSGVRVETTRAVYEAGSLVFTAGAWAGSLVPAVDGLAVPERQVLVWLQPQRPDLFTREHFPVFNLEVDEGRYYGLPVHGVPGFKLGRYHHLGGTADPDRMDRSPNAEDELILRSFADRYFPLGAGPTMALKVCMFTNTPDEHFILDRHPEQESVLLAAGFSGHGFKFCSVVGEIMADLTVAGRSRHDIGLFRLDRFALRP